MHFEKKSSDSARIHSIEGRLKIIKKNKANLRKLITKERVKPNSNKITNNKCKKSFHKDILSEIKFLLDGMSQSNGSKYYEKQNIKIGIVADEFLYNSWASIADLVYITPDNFEEVKNKIELFIVVTTWRGLNGEWRGIVSESETNQKLALINAIESCKNNNIKTVFYSKEDPVNYKHFIGIARLCDFVFTTAVEVTEDYIRDCGHDKVSTLQFGINPVYHNPISLRKNTFKNAFLFSGSWMEKYPERGDDTKLILDGIIEAGYRINIIDRNSDIDSVRYKFPDKYNESLYMCVPHKYLQNLHKLYCWSVNLNSVQNSKTMFANRIFELQALGNCLISNYSLGVQTMFPNVFMPKTKEEISDYISKIDDIELYKMQLSGVRDVMSHHCNQDKFTKLLQVTGVPFELPKKRKVVVLYSDKIDSILSDISKQSYDNIIHLRVDEFTKDIYESVDIVVFMSVDYSYENYYIEDLVNGFKYTNSSYITKDAYDLGGRVSKGISHDFVDFVKDENRTAYWVKDFLLEDFHSRKSKLTGNLSEGYSIDPFQILLK